jgi:predicted dehydrogenase
MIRIAIIGTGSMANTHAEELKKIEGTQLVAACDIAPSVAKEFATKHEIKNVFNRVEDLIKFKEFDAVANVTSDRYHYETTIPLLEAGKHVLCEKPLAENYDDALKMSELAESKGLVNMVNFSYRNASAIQNAYKIVQSGEIGEVIHLEASYLQSWLVSKAWGDWKNESRWLWRLSTQHGSKGVLGDVGVHILDFATYPIGQVEKISCVLKTFDNVKGNRIGKYPLDANDSAVINLIFKNGAIGTVHTTRWAVGHNNTVSMRLFGSKGSLRINLDKSPTKLEWCVGENIDDAKWDSLECGITPNIHELFIKSIKNGVHEKPDFKRGAEIQRLLDVCESSSLKGQIMML